MGGGEQKKGNETNKRRSTAKLERIIRDPDNSSLLGRWWGSFIVSFKKLILFILVSDDTYKSVLYPIISIISIVTFASRRKRTIQLCNGYNYKRVPKHARAYFFYLRLRGLESRRLPTRTMRGLKWLFPRVSSRFVSNANERKLAFYYACTNVHQVVGGRKREKRGGRRGRGKKHALE